MFAVVCLPEFPLQAVLRHEPGLRVRPVALVDPALPKPAIMQITPAARARGVREGQTASQAMARCADLVIKQRSPDQEQSATDILLQTAYAFSPIIEATAPGVCTLELKGLGLGTEEAVQKWAHKILDALGSMQLGAAVGIAATPGLALLAARSPGIEIVFNAIGNLPLWQTELEFGIDVSENNGRAALPRRPDPTKTSEATFLPRANDVIAVNTGSIAMRSPVVIVRDAAAFAINLPLASLDLPPEMADVLARWGVATVGALLALGKDALADRLGPAAVEVFERLSPDASRPLKAIVPTETFEERMDFPNEIETAAPLLFVLGRFVEQLARRTELIYLVVAELHLRLGLSSGATYERVFKIPAPTGNVSTLFRMLQTHLETVRTDAPIISLRLTARPARPELRQFGLFETTLRDPNQFAETLARLVALCGPDRAGTPVPESTHRPDAFRIRAPDFAGPAGVWPAAPDERPAGLPLRRLRPVVRVDVEFRGQRPVSCRGAVFNGGVAGARGPFFSSGNWWDVNQWWREEWDVQTADGTIYRIFRSGDGCFVEGVYD